MNATTTKAITTKAEAEGAIDELADLIKKLAELVARETDLVQAGRIRGAAEIEPVKKDLAGRLFALNERLKANARFLLQTAPARCAALKGMQDAFRAVLRKNMIALGTAHAVSEGIVRRLSGEITRKTSPQVYGASGRTMAPNPRSSRPLAVSRSL